MTMAGTAMPAMRVMPTGAPIRVPSCHRIFFFLLQGFFPQNVQPDGLMEGKHREGKRLVWDYSHLGTEQGKVGCHLHNMIFIIVDVIVFYNVAQ